MTTGAVDPKELALAALQVMSTEDRSEFSRLVHAEATNREAVGEPPDCRVTGPEGFRATARWLHTAFSDLRWQVHDAVEDGDLVVLHTTMSGRQTGPFVGYGPDARPKIVFPPTGRTFAVTQTHWFRLRDGQVVEHWANRDDRGMGEQLGWTPPTPVYLARMLVATRRARAARPDTRER
jgi:predicted ester cyclase